MSKILVLSGSNRAGSFNTKLVAAAAKELALMGADVTQLSLIDYPLPLYDEDLKTNEGIPDHVFKLAKQLVAHDGIFISSPEYNASISPLLKNMIDWVSKVTELDGKPCAPWKEIVVALGAAAPGAMGGVRGLNHVRAIFTSVGSLTIAEQVLVPNAGSAFDADGHLVADRSRAALSSLCKSLIRHSQR